MGKVNEQWVRAAITFTASFLTVLGLTACGGDSSDSTDTETDAADESSETEDTSEAVTNEVMFVVVDTMQSECFDNDGESITCPAEGEALKGQDAQYDGFQPSFTDNGDGTVSDDNTGLVWQQTPDYSQYSYDEAIAYCESLSLGDYDDWRLPEIKELYSLADFRGEIVDSTDSSLNTPYIDTTYFDFEYNEDAMYLGQYWSITKYDRGPVQATQDVEVAFGFNFADGHLKGYETGYEFGTDNETIFAPGNYVRCVYGEESVYGVNEFVDNGNGTVTDNATGLMWMQADDGERRDWESALDYAESSEFVGYTDWRLPNIKELQSIVEYEGEEGIWPAIDTDFFTLSGDYTTSDPTWFWSSTTQGDFKYTAAYISFGKAYSKENSDATQYYDWHGAGAQRSDPKSGEPEDYELASENATDLIMTKNYSLLARDVTE